MDKFSFYRGLEFHRDGVRCRVESVKLTITLPVRYYDMEVVYWAEREGRHWASAHELGKALAAGEIVLEGGS